jgi:hypothetical protein
LEDTERTSRTFDAILKAKLNVPLDMRLDCPDPSALAALYDHSVIGIERGRMEDHVSDCARCQAMLAAMVRADDDLLTQPRTGRRFNWGLLLIRFAAPAFATLMGVVIVLELRHRFGNEQPVAELAMNSPVPQAASAPIVASGSPNSLPVQPPSPPPPPAASGSAPSGGLPQPQAQMALATKSERSPAGHALYGSSFGAMAGGFTAYHARSAPPAKRAEIAQAEMASPSAAASPLQMASPSDLAAPEAAPGVGFTIKYPDNNAF